MDGAVAKNGNKVRAKLRRGFKDLGRSWFKERFTATLSTVTATWEGLSTCFPSK